MSKLILPVLLVALVGGGGYFYANYEFEIQRDADGKLQYAKITPAAGSPSPPDPASPSEETPVVPRKTIRIATFNLAALSEAKLGNRQVSDILMSVLPQFDVVAIQDVQAANQGTLVRLVERINATGAQYDYAVSPDVQRGTVKQYGAFLFDKTIIEIDRSTVLSVSDAADRFHCDPLVALFRVRGPEPAEAFTFKLINVHTDSQRAAVEIDLLDDVYRAVRDQTLDAGGQLEDDIILLGGFGTDGNHAKRLNQLLGITSTIGRTPTTIGGRLPVDDILFDRQATAEFTGRSAVFDLIREFDLSLPAAREVSNHLPVWAEFSRYEGGQAGHIATKAPRTTR